MTARKWGGEFTVNTLTAGIQSEPTVTALADGGFMVAWRDANPAIDEIKMQRYDALGNLATRCAARAAPVSSSEGPATTASRRWAASTR